MKKINTFWNWFQDNHHTLKNIINETPENQKYITFWITKNLNYYCREIDFMIVFPKDITSKFGFIITANGDKDYFNQVITLIDNAPLLKSWQFTAFIQDTNTIVQKMNTFDEQYIFKDITLKIKELTFREIVYNENCDKTNSMIFLKNYSLLYNNKTLMQAIYLASQELNHPKKIPTQMNFIQLPQKNMKKDELIQLYELQWYLDYLSQQKNY
ncbi:hypothetical protein [Flavobacterium sp. ACAM 123]|uniref:hypothetical protein n=1 Tax=Flavobacterium sp. ACAM 123 TaxID=1189620 RepID=UPI0002E3AE68|nr:hypothetical protein [Flavobacterium sp. ACAM 123]